MNLEIGMLEFHWVLWELTVHWNVTYDCEGLLGRLALKLNVRHFQRIIIPFINEMLYPMNAKVAHSLANMVFILFCIIYRPTINPGTVLVEAVMLL